MLLPFRGFLGATRWGWWLWLVFLGIGILGTPAAAPGSFEGALYTRLPWWFHVIGWPEVALQTLAFSILTHRTLRAAEHPLSPALRTVFTALAVACISFVGYTVVSLAFAFATGAGLASGSDPRVLGQFVAPLVITFAVVLLTGSGWWVAKNAALYVLSAGSLAVYQALVLDSVGWPSVLLAPILPVAISVVLTKPKGAARPSAGDSARNALASRRWGGHQPTRRRMRPERRC